MTSVETLEGLQQHGRDLQHLAQHRRPGARRSRALAHLAALPGGARSPFLSLPWGPVR